MEIQTINPLEIERAKINQLDEILISLFEERLKIVLNIAEIKKQNNLPIFQANREKEILEKITRLSQNSKFILNIFKTIMQESKKFQEERLCKFQ
jgi:monofunctional chorismate mutase